jgi:hypothetical protein
MSISRSRIKKIVYSLIPLIVLLIAAEIGLFFYINSNKKYKKTVEHVTPIINFKKKTDNEKILSEYRKISQNYYVFDSVLGVRFRPNAVLIALEAKHDGSPRIAKSIKLHTDSFGFIHNKEDVNANTDYKKLSKDNEIYKIIVSGGSSTSWGATDNSKTWPAYLEYLLNNIDNPFKQRYKQIIVINTGVFGYSISNEIRRFQSETIYLNPDLLIVFNGINEKHSYNSNPVDYSLSGHHIRIQKLLNLGNGNSISVIFPYIFKALIDLPRLKNTPNYNELYGYRTKNYITVEAENLYISKIKQFEALAKSHQIDFIYFLQPIMGIGNKKLTAKEQSLKKFFGSVFYREDWASYQNRLNLFYIKTSQLLEIERNKSFINFKNVFDNDNDTLYNDPRHYNNEGHKIIAKKIFEVLKKRCSSFYH